MIKIFFLKEFIISVIVFYLAYSLLYYFTYYRINKIMNDKIKIVHVKWILYIPLWFFILLIFFNLYMYVK